MSDQQQHISKKIKITPVTPGLPAQVKHVDPANLEQNNNNNQSKRKDQQALEQLALRLLPPRPVLEEAILARRKCKLTQIMLPEPGEDVVARAREIQSCLQVVQNCLIASGVLPIDTPDPSDKEVVGKVFDALPSAPQVFSIAYIIHALLLSPELCRYFIDNFGVSERQLDAFANTLQSPVTAHQAWYINGRIQSTVFFVVHAVQQWLEFGPPTRTESNDK